MSEREPIKWVAGRYGVSYSAWQGGQRVGCVYRVAGSAWCLSIDAPRGTGPGAHPALTRRVVCHWCATPSNRHTVQRRPS